MNMNIDPCEEGAAIDLLRGVLAEGVNRGRFRRIDSDRVAGALYAIYVMYIIKTNNRSDEGQVHEMFEQTMDMVYMVS